jgi:hypothetical protein
LKGWSTFSSTSPSRVALALRTECQERLFERRSPSTRRWSICCKKVRKRLKSLAQAQFSPARGISVRAFDLIPCVCRRFLTALPTIFLVLVALSMELLQVSTSSRTSARRLRGRVGARALSRAMDRGAGRGYVLADARISRACFCAQLARFAPPQGPCACRPVGPIQANWGQKGPFAGTACCARKMRKVYWQLSFYTS